MCVLQGIVLDRGKEHPVRILIDSGSSHQYVSSSFIRKTSLEVEKRRNSPHWVQVANGTYMEAPGMTHFTLAIARYRTRVEARVLELPEYDIILGLDWLRTANPVIDWQEMNIQVRNTGGELCELYPRDTTRYIRTQEATYAIEDIDPISVAQVDRIIRQPGSSACLFSIRERSSNTTAYPVADSRENLPQVTNRDASL